MVGGTFLQNSMVFGISLIFLYKTFSLDNFPVELIHPYFTREHYRSHFYPYIHFFFALTCVNKYYELINFCIHFDGQKNLCTFSSTNSNEYFSIKNNK